MGSEVDFIGFEADGFDIDDAHLFFKLIITNVDKNSLKKKKD